MKPCDIIPLTITRESSIKAVKQVLSSRRVPVHQNVQKVGDVEQYEDKKFREEKYEQYN